MHNEGSFSSNLVKLTLPEVPMAVMGEGGRGDEEDSSRSSAMAHRDLSRAEVRNLGMRNAPRVEIRTSVMCKQTLAKQNGVWRLFAAFLASPQSSPSWAELCRLSLSQQLLPQTSNSTTSSSSRIRIRTRREGGGGGKLWKKREWSEWSCLQPICNLVSSGL